MKVIDALPQARSRDSWVAMARPMIGLTLDAEDAGGWSRYPWHALRQNYFSAIAESGGLPVALPHDAGLTDDYLDRLDALVVTGGAFDVDPALYGQHDRHASVTLKARRTEAEMALLRGALARDMPILGICGGQQALAVALGGTLVQHIPDRIPHALPHEQPNPRHEPGHEVSIVPGTLLARIVGTDRVAVNSSHHQAVDDPGHARVDAMAPDGVVEGIECAEARFVLGVQWHPEFLVGPADRAILDALVAAARA